MPRPGQRLAKQTAAKRPGAAADVEPGPPGEHGRHARSRDRRAAPRDRRRAREAPRPASAGRPPSPRSSPCRTAAMMVELGEDATCLRRRDAEPGRHAHETLRPRRREAATGRRGPGRPRRRRERESAEARRDAPLARSPLRPRSRSSPPSRSRAADIVIVVTDAAGQRLQRPDARDARRRQHGHDARRSSASSSSRRPRASGARSSRATSTIKVDSSFQPLDCDATTAVLGSAGRDDDLRGLPERARRGHLVRQGRSPTSSRAYLETRHDAAPSPRGSTASSGKTGCLTGTFFYLGLDNNHGHEHQPPHRRPPRVRPRARVLLGRGLDGHVPGRARASSRHLRPLPLRRDGREDVGPDDDGRRARRPRRRTRATSSWNGASANDVRERVPGARPRLLVTAPAAAAGAYAVGTADFGPPLSSARRHGADRRGAGRLGRRRARLRRTRAARSRTPRASPARSPSSTAGTCAFVVKVKNAQNAGAIGADHRGQRRRGRRRDGRHGRDDHDPVRPASRMADGAKLRANLPATANLGVDPTQYAGRGRGRPPPHVRAEPVRERLVRLALGHDAPPRTSSWSRTSSDDLGIDDGRDARRVPATSAGSSARRRSRRRTSCPRARTPRAQNNAFYTTSLTDHEHGRVDATLDAQVPRPRPGRPRRAPRSTRVVAAGADRRRIPTSSARSSASRAASARSGSTPTRTSSRSSARPRRRRPPASARSDRPCPRRPRTTSSRRPAPKALFSLRQDAAFRTNAVIANATEAAGPRRPRALQLGGRPDRRPARHDLEPARDAPDRRRRHGARRRRARHVERGLSSSRRRPPDARIATYAAVIDQKTNDPRTILPVTLGTLGANGDVAPALERARAGREQRLLHDRPHDRERGHDGRDRHAQVPRPRPGRPQRRPRPSRRSPRTPPSRTRTSSARSSASRAATARSSSRPTTADLKIVSQTSTPPPTGVGTFGQSVPAFGRRRLRHARRAEVARRPSGGLRVPDERRHRERDGPAGSRRPHAHVRRRARRSGRSALDLLPYEMRQIGTVVTALGAPFGTTNAVLVVSTPTTGARIATYAAIIDNVTNDPRTILP